MKFDESIHWILQWIFVKKSYLPTGTELNDLEVAIRMSTSWGF